MLINDGKLKSLKFKGNVYINPTPHFLECPHLLRSPPTFLPTMPKTTRPISDQTNLQRQGSARQRLPTEKVTKKRTYQLGLMST